MDGGNEWYLIIYSNTFVVRLSFYFSIFFGTEALAILYRFVACGLICLRVPTKDVMTKKAQGVVVGSEQEFIKWLLFSTLSIAF